MTCPECGGVGGIQWMDEWGAFTEYMPCETCNGTGEIPDESTVYGIDCRDGKCEW